MHDSRDQSLLVQHCVPSFLSQQTPEGSPFMSDLNPSDYRILIVDDNEAIHDDFRKVLQNEDTNSDLQDAAAAFFGKAVESDSTSSFHIQSAYQGREAYEMVTAAVAECRPFSMAFVDMRMPPGWDGVQTIQHLWQVDPQLPIVICTAYADYSFDEMTEQLGHPERWLLLKKPFDHVEVRQLAYGLTEKWRLARQVEMKLNVLEELVEERTREITAAREQLLQTQKMESLGTLAGGIAHEFNNLLQVITGYAQFIEADLPQDSPMLEDLNQIKTASGRAAELTRRLLGFSRRQELHRSVFPISSLLEELGGLLKPVLSERITLTVDCDCPELTVHGDSAQMQQAILNLCINAADAMPSGGNLTITVAVDTDDGGASDPGSDGNRRIRIDVADTGTGMPEDVVRRAFDPFFTTKGVGEGTGLGLPFVHGVVQEHGGTITVDSTPGHGTVFTIVIPETTDDARPDAGEPDPPAFAPSVDHQGTRTVLVAEDEDAVRRLSVRTLEAAGFQVHSAGCGKEAVDIFQRISGDVALCVLDMVLPDMSGREIAAAFREIRSDVAILFCTGYDPEEQFDPAICHSEEVMSKPFNPSQLATTVDRLTSGSAAAP